MFVPGKPFQPSGWVRAGANPRVEHLKGDSLGKAPAYPRTLEKVGKACQGQTL